MAAELEVVHEEVGFRVGISGTLVIGAWPGPALPRHLDEFRRGELQVLERGDRLHLIIALKLHPGGIDNEMRTKGEALQREFAEHIVGQSVVLAGSGLLAATVRAFASGLNLLSRARVPTKTFGQPVEALRWLASIPGPPEETTAHLYDLRDTVRRFTTDLYE